jgi:hypothetical protein
MKRPPRNPYSCLTPLELLDYIQLYVPMSEGADVLSELTPGFVGAKAAIPGSTRSLLGDFALAAEVAVQKTSFDQAFKFALLRDVFAEEGKSQFSGIKAALRARGGNWSEALEDVIAVGDNDDQILVRAERFVGLFEESRDAADDELRLLQSLAASCSPEAVELAAVRVADASPEAAIGLALCIPEPGMLIDGDFSRFKPTKERCLWEIAKRTARRGVSRAREASLCLREDLAKAVFLTAVACGLLCKSPGKAVAQLKSIVSALPETAVRYGLMHVFTRHVLWQLPQMGTPAAIEAYRSVFDLTPLRADRPEFDRTIDAAVRQCPDKWMRAGEELPDGPARQFLLWRLAVMGFGGLPPAEPDVVDPINGVLRAYHFLAKAEQSVSDAIREAPAVVGVAGLARAIAGLIDLTLAANPEAARDLGSYAFKQLRLEEDADGLDASLVLLRSLLPHGGQLCADIILWYVETAGKELPRFVRTEVRCSLGQVLAKGLTASMPHEAYYWGQILQALERECDRATVAAWLLEQLPCEPARCIATQPIDFGLYPPAGEEDIMEGRALFLPETQARLLVALARTVGRTSPAVMADVLRKAAEATRHVRNDRDRRDVVSEVLGCAFQFDVDNFWGYCEQCACELSVAMFEVKRALGEIAVTSVADVRDAFLRLEVEYFFSVGHCKESESALWYTRNRMFAVESQDVPPLGVVERHRPEVDVRWQDGIMCFAREYMNRAPAKDHKELGTLCVPIAEFAWDTFMHIVRDPSLGPVVCRAISADTLQRAALLCTKGWREVLEDVHFIESAAKANATGWDPRGFRTLAAAAAAYSPTLCLVLLRKDSQGRASLFTKDLCLFTPHARWEDALLSGVLDRLEAGLKEREATECQAAFLGWISACQPVSRKVLDRVVLRALSLDDPSDAVDVAKAMTSNLADARMTILRGALKQAVLKRSSAAIRTVLRHFDAATPTERAEALKVADGAEDQDSRRLLNIAAEEAKQGSEAAVRFLETLEAGDEEAEGILEELVKHLALGAERDVTEWLARINGCASLSLEHKEHFTRLLITRGIESGMVRSLEPLSYLTDGADRGEAYCQLLEMRPEVFRVDAVTEIMRNIEEMVSANSRLQAGVRVAKFFGHKDPERALALYRYALRQAAKLDSAMALAITFGSLPDEILSMPDAHLVSLAEIMYDTAREFRKPRDPFDSVGTRAQLLLWVGLGFWVARDPRASAVLTEAIRKYCEAVDDDPLTSFEPIVALACRWALRSRGLEYARGFLSEVLVAAPSRIRARLADRVCLQFRDPTLGEREGPLHDYGVWQKKLTREESELLRCLLDASTAEGKAMAYLALSVSSLDLDREMARAEIERAMEVVEHEGEHIQDNTYRSICVIYAMCGGPQSLVRSLLAVCKRPGLVQEGCSYLIAACVNAHSRPEAFIKNMWRALGEVREYLRERER